MAHSAFENALQQLDNAAKKIGLAPHLLEQLKKPQAVHRATISVAMDSGEVKEFIGFRSQYNNARGPYKGGIRFHPNVSEDEVTALSFWMAIKCATLNLPLGGGKG
jgi:glutamate dehydrogenase/leucine dehydrogenase